MFFWENPTGLAVKGLADGGDDLDAITGWLQTNVPKAAELYLAVLNDHVDELRDQLNERVSGDL